MGEERLADPYFPLAEEETRFSIDRLFREAWLVRTLYPEQILTPDTSRV